MRIDRRVKEPTFEEVYPTAEFSELIRLGLLLTAAGLRVWARLNPRYEPPHLATRSNPAATQSANPGCDPSPPDQSLLAS